MDKHEERIIHRIIQRPFLSEKAEEAIFISCVPREVIEEFDSVPSTLPHKNEIKHSHLEAMAFLATLPEGAAVIFPMYYQLKRPEHAQRLRMAATRVGIGKIAVHDYDEKNLLVENLDPRSNKPALEFLHMPQVHNWKLQKKREHGEDVVLPEEDEKDYKVYIEAVVTQNLDYPGSGILFPLSNKSVLYQQTRLHHTAKLRRVKITATRWDAEHLLVKFAGYWMVG